MVTAKNKNQLIGEWLQGLLTDLKYDDGKRVFKKVLLGFDEQKIKTFGDGVLATTYVSSTDYNETFGLHNRPTYIHSVVAFIIKGSTEARYKKATEIKDLLEEKYEVDKFDANHEWIKLENPVRVVRDTDVIRSDLTFSPAGKKLDILGLMELRHHVYK